MVEYIIFTNFMMRGKSMITSVAPIEGVVSMDTIKDTLLAYKQNIKEIPIADIEEIMGINKITPIDGTSSIKRAVDEEEDYFKEWYENDLRQQFERFIEAALRKYS